MATYKILNNGVEINSIVADESFCVAYCEKHGYSYELLSESETEPEAEAEPTQLDIIEAQVTYTAMMTDTLLEV